MDTKNTTVAQIDARLSALVRGMADKGFVTPRADLWIQADGSNTGYVEWKGGTAHTYGQDLEPLDKAEAWLAEQPSVEERNHQEFLKALGSVIELGRKHNIDVAAVNPLERLMKKLSDGALPAPVAPPVAVSADDMPF